tara:strand:+ start:1736 stop:3559 length:1824 start_codon:yes stop_codon:yes gene_type:complete
VLENNIIIAGGGHAGIEAALAISKMGFKSTLVTLNKSAIGRMSCNPAIGGLAKGHLVKEIDALGGVMGKITDQVTIQNKILNKSKGRAVWAPRAQVDKIKYTKLAQGLIQKNSNIVVLEDEVVDFKTKNNKIVAAILKNNNKINCTALIITCGTFMSGLIHIGNKQYRGGRIGEKHSFGLSEALMGCGFKMGRLKTGTPPRADKSSIDFSCLEIAAGEKKAMSFSMFTPKPYTPKNIPCYLAYTTKITHEIINNNIKLSSMFSGKISGAGPRYCPSVEDKVVRFADRDRHQLFLEPEWENSNQIYINGFSTSLPERIQIQALKSVQGLEKIKLIRPGYAIEYDYMPSYQLKASLETKAISGLFCAGQLNGTSGYEEAAAQGLLAGINAAQYVQKKDPLILSRASSYIGVLIDDLITKYIDEPYRMFTSRAENRLFLRADTAPFRLCEIAIKHNMLTKKESQFFKNYQKQYIQLNQDLRGVSIKYQRKNTPILSLLKRPEITFVSLNNNIINKIIKKYPEDIVFSVETAIKYFGYEQRELDRIKKIKKLDNLKISKTFNYNKIQNLSSESKEKLSTVRPETLGQASRVAGVRSSDIAVLSIALLAEKK